ncbi:MAG: AzlD domain-containing protein, partial [Anaerolineae bacterium]|nr:AzlD domain-containing protein [Anaerolineae bacterium]
GIVTFVVAWRTKNVLVTIIAGMIVFWLLKALFGQF